MFYYSTYGFFAALSALRLLRAFGADDGCPMTEAALVCEVIERGTSVVMKEALIEESFVEEEPFKAFNPFSPPLLVDTVLDG